LTAQERAELERLVKKGKAARWKLQRAQALLQCDQGPDGPGWTDQLVAAAYGCTTRTLESWRQQGVEAGPLSLLQRKPRLTPPVQPKLDGEQQARLTTLACSQAPPGYARWTLRLRAERLVELEVVQAISHETVRRALTKAPGSRGGRRWGASRPSRTRPASATGSRCWRSSNAPTTPSGRSSAWTSSPNR
jgi:hypothetical protein